MTARERFSIDAALAALGDAAAAPVRQRLAALAYELHERTNGTMTMRDDSRLAFLFCTGALGPEWTRDEVVHEMMCIQHISGTTAYVRASQGALRIVAEHLKAETQAPWSAVWRTVSTLGADAVKYACMAEANTRFGEAPPPPAPRLWADMEEEDCADA